MTKSPYPEPAPWAAPLRAIVSKGRTVTRPGSLSGLAAARAAHGGQFFTPDNIAARLWQLVAPSIETLRGVRKAQLLDTSIGSARLLQFADPERTAISGCDPDEQVVAAVAQVLRESGFEGEVVAAGMETCRPRGYDIALLNPPFSVTLQSPHLVPGPVTTYGPYGPHTSALSQWYALQQALEAARIVAAILPLQDLERLADDPQRMLGDAGKRLLKCYRLPAGSFREEGTEVATGIVLFGPESGVQRPEIEALPVDRGPIDAPALPLSRHRAFARLNVVLYRDDSPVITQPVTGDRFAELHHNGRRLVVKTRCGFTRALVMNAILGDLLPPVERHETRRPKGVEAEGHFRLDREFLLAQADWRAALADLQARAVSVGVILEISPGLLNHLEKRSRQTARQRAPMGRVVADPTGLVADATRTLEGMTTRALLSDPTRWDAPAIPRGTRVTVRSDGAGGWVVSSGSVTIPATESLLRLCVQMDARAEREEDASRGWHRVSPDLIEQGACAEVVDKWRRRLVAVGARAWLWDYQFEDCADLLTKPRGAIAAWHTGLGKARLAAALCLASGGKRNVVLVPARLVPEIDAEWKSIPLPDRWWKIVRKPKDLDWDTPVLLIALEHLRAPIGRGGRRTLAALLRRRVSTLVVDEADFLANPNSDQTRAVWALSARRRFLLTATPIANYPRDVFPLLAFAAGDGTAGQPFGWHRSECVARGWSTARYVRPGRDAIREDFTTLTWVTNEFADTLREGAKREIPLIRDLSRFREALAPAIKRRIHGEPAVEKFVKVPVPVWEEPRIVEWDEEHLAYFLRVADNFADWYRRYREQMGERPSSLVTLLARIGAVERAGNCPMHFVEGGTVPYPHPTSKQKAVLEHLLELVDSDERSLVYARHPAALDWVARALAEQGIQAVVLHGGRSIKRRLDDLDKLFRFGDAPVVLASFGTGDRGLNIPQATNVILMDRDWSARTERQCVGRTLRPQQTVAPRVRPFHLPGSLDDYMAQLTAFKAEAASAGVDWGVQTLNPEDFLHLDTVIERFITNLAERRGMTRASLRDQLSSRRQHA